MPSATELITGSVGPVRSGSSAGVCWSPPATRWPPALLAPALGLAGWALALRSWAVTILLARGSACSPAPDQSCSRSPGPSDSRSSVAMGALAFEHDVVGSDFGLPQVLSGVAVVALLVALVPVGVAAVDGRWYQPDGGFGRVLELVDDGDSAPTVWIGDPDVLPLAGWPLDAMAGLSVGTSVGVDPLVTQRYRLDGGAGIVNAAGGDRRGADGQTSRLGRLLAPMGVQYVVVVDRPAPQPFAA